MSKLITSILTLCSFVLRCGYFSKLFCLREYGEVTEFREVFILGFTF